MAGDQQSRPAASLGEKLDDTVEGPRANVIRGQRDYLSVPKARHRSALLIGVLITRFSFFSSKRRKRS